MIREVVLIDLIGPVRVILKGILYLPEAPKALIVMVHNDDVDSLSHHNTTIIHQFVDRDMAVLSMNLLTPVEAEVYQNRFNASLLGDRLVQVTIWTMDHHILQSLPFGYFGNGTSAGPALQAAAILDGQLKAVVSFNGHPELARHALGKVSAATLLIVGELDKEGVHLNQIAYDQLRHEKEMIIVKDATPSFEELGALEKVSQHATDWMDEHLLWPILSSQDSDQG